MNGHKMDKRAGIFLALFFLEVTTPHDPLLYMLMTLFKYELYF